MAGKSNDRLGMTAGAVGAASNPGEEVDRSTKRDEDGTEREPRAGREAEENREISDDERLEMFLSTFVNSTLPEMPAINGFHLCWLSTTNTKDTIHARLRIGYVLVKPEEVPGWQNLKLNNGDYAGYVGVNEMVLAKLSDRLFQRFMAEVHHNLPLKEASKLRYQAEGWKGQAQAKGANLLIEEGLSNIDQHRPTPDFTNPDWRVPRHFIDQDTLVE